MAIEMLLLGALAMSAPTQSSHVAELQQQLEAAKAELVLAGSKRSAELEKALPAGCLSFPLPTKPVGPTWQMRHTFYNDTADIIAWRQPCSSTQSVVMITIKPITTSAFVCSFDAVIQGGAQYSRAQMLQDDRGFDSICGDIYVPVTGWLSVSSPAGFNPNNAFTIHDSHLPTPLSVPAYKPGDYNVATPAAKITKDYSGGWHTPGVENQGWALIFNDDLNVGGAYWFTGSADGKQIEWFTALGEFSGDTVEMDVYRTTGVTFGGTTGQTKDFGTLKIDFENCDSGVATYDLHDGRKGSLPIGRLLPAPQGCK